MQIVDYTAKSNLATNLNMIPVGTVFRGNILGPNSGRWARGMFIKTSGSVRPFPKDALCHNKVADCVVVCLDDDWMVKSPNNCNVYLQCATVQDYEPLDVELRILGPAKG